MHGISFVSAMLLTAYNSVYSILFVSNVLLGIRGILFICAVLLGVGSILHHARQQVRHHRPPYPYGSKNRA